MNMKTIRIRRFHMTHSKHLIFFRVLLTGICVAGIVLRTYDLSATPPGFFADEATMGLDAYSLLTTGKSAHGELFPIFFQQFDIYVGPFLIYLMIPFFFLFGPTVQAARLAAAAASIATLAVLWAIGRAAFPNRRIPQLYLLLVVALAPWGIKTGRIAGLNSVYTFFFSLTLLFFFLSTRHIRAYLAAWATAGIAAYAYFSAYIQMPFVVVGMIAAWRPSWFGRRFLYGVLLITIITIPLALHIQSGKATVRLGQLGGIKTSAMHQKYGGHFSPEFLFTRGDGFYRNHIHGFGLFYRHDALFLLIGVITLLVTRNIFLLWCLFVVYPLPGTLTADGASDIRSIIGSVVIPLVMAYGVDTVVRILERYPYRRTMLLLAGSGYVLTTAYMSAGFFVEYFHRYATYAGGYYGWQYGYPQILAEIQPYMRDYDDILITHRFNGPEELLAFHTLTSPCAQCRVMSNPISIDQNRTQLFALRSDDMEEARALYPTMVFHSVATVHLPNGTPEFFIGRFSRPRVNR